MTDWLGAESTDKRRQEITETQMLAREQLLSDMAWVLSDERGRRCVVNMLKHCRLGTSNFTGNSETFKLEGKREVALAFLDWMKQADPEKARQIVADLFVGELP